MVGILHMVLSFLVFSHSLVESGWFFPNLTYNPETDYLCIYEPLLLHKATTLFQKAYKILHCTLL